MEYVAINGAQIAYATHGTGEQPLVLLHGAYLNHGQWQPQIAALAAHYRVIIPDLRGHGQSGRSGQPFTVRQFADDIAALLRKIAMSPTIICGHSLGGMVAQSLAFDHPALVRKLILAETSYGTRATRLEAVLTDLVTPLLLLAPVAPQARYFARALGERSPHARSYLRRTVAAYAAEPETYRAIWRAVVGFASRERIAAIQVPTLVLAGTENPQTHAQARTLARTIPNARLEFVAGAGHLLNWDAPEAFTDAVLRFIETGFS
jgi:3-oxoadipate enol-lactonase